MRHCNKKFVRRQAFGVLSRFYILRCVYYNFIANKRIYHKIKILLVMFFKNNFPVDINYFNPKSQYLYLCKECLTILVLEKSILAPPLERTIKKYEPLRINSSRKSKWPSPAAEIRKKRTISHFNAKLLVKVSIFRNFRT